MIDQILSIDSHFLWDQHCIALEMYEQNNFEENRDEEVPLDQEDASIGEQ